MYTVLLWCRVLAFLVVSIHLFIIPNLLFGYLTLKTLQIFASPNSDSICFHQACQILRILTFYSTQLPGPNYHCREVFVLKKRVLYGLVSFASHILIVLFSSVLFTFLSMRDNS